MAPNRTLVLLAVVLGSGIVFLDSTVVNVALPRIGAELPATLVGVLEGQTYVNSGYLAALSALLVLAGALSDFHGRRRMFLVGLTGFGATSVLCGIAPTMEVLVVCRILQGAAGALLVPGALSIITATFEGAERGRAFGIWASATSATVLLGPMVGGILVDTVSWRAAFLINVPLVAIAVAATLRGVPESRDQEAAGGRFDWVGAAVIAIGVGGLAFGAIRGQERQWNDVVAFVALGIGAVATAAFPVLMARSANPLVPLDLFRSRNFAITNLSTFVIYGALYVSGVFQGLFLQNTLGYTAFAAGASGLPVALFLTTLSTPVGTIAARLGPRRFLAAGPAIMAAGVLWLARIPSTSPPWRASVADPSSLVPSSGYLIDVLPGMILFGLGVAILVAPLTTTVMASVPVRNAGLGSAINNAVSRVGAPLVGALLFIAITATYFPSLADKLGLPQAPPELRKTLPPLNRPAATATPAQVEAAREASTDAFHLAMLVSAGLLASGAAINALGIRDAAAASGPADARPAEAGGGPDGIGPAG